MGVKDKLVAPDPWALTSLYRDVSGGRCRTFTIEAFPCGIISDKYLAKCSSLIAGTSGNWLVVIPHRVDHGNSGLVIDKDPFIILWENLTQSPCPSGIFMYHSPASWNHIPIEGNAKTRLDALIELKDKVLQQTTLIEALPESEKRLLGDMVELSQKRIAHP
jgi:hypothetical protein